jgi:hypothetical protein
MMKHAELVWPWILGLESGWNFAGCVWGVHPIPSNESCHQFRLSHPMLKSSGVITGNEGWLCVGESSPNYQYESVLGSTISA